MHYRFGPFELDADGYRLTREGEVVPVEPRVLEVLAYLIAHRDRLVDKEELVRKVWGGAFVSDASVARAVSELRAALGDTAETQRWIATVYGRGYSFVGEVEEIGDEAEGPSRPAYRGLALALSAGLLLVAVLGVFLWRARQDARDAGASAGAPVRLAVLPFESIAPGEEGWFAAGLTEEIITRLATVDELAVISRTTSGRYGDAALETIAEDLGVAYVLEGGVRLELGPDGLPHRIRITPQLIRIVDDTHVWTEVYDREVDDIFAVQADLAEQVASALDFRLSSGEIEDLERPPTDDIEAYAAYLRGLEIEARGTTVDHHHRAAGMFERAIELDPDFAAAFARLAVARLGIYDMFSANTWEEAQAALSRARELAPDSLETLIAEAVLAYGGPRPDNARAAAILERVIEAAPSLAVAHEHLGRVRRDQGRFEEALRHLERAVDLDRRHARAPFVLADTYTAMRRFEDADAMWRRVIGEAPDNALAWSGRALNQILWRGDVSAAWKLLEQRPEGVEISLDVRAYLGLCARRFDHIAELVDALDVEDLNVYVAFYAVQAYRRTGREDRVQPLAEALLEIRGSLPERFPEHPYSYLATSYPLALLGRGDEALDHMQKAFGLAMRESPYIAPQFLAGLAVVEIELGLEDEAIDRIAELLEMEYQFPLTRARLRIEPWWDPLRDHPEFQALLRPAS